MDLPGKHDIPENAQNPLSNNRDASHGFDDVKTSAPKWCKEENRVL